MQTNFDLLPYSIIWECNAELFYIDYKTRTNNELLTFLMSIDEDTLTFFPLIYTFLVFMYSNAQRSNCSMTLVTRFVTMIGPIYVPTASIDQWFRFFRSSIMPSNWLQRRWRGRKWDGIIIRQRANKRIKRYSSALRWNNTKGSFKQRHSHWKISLFEKSQVLASLEMN